MKYINNAGVYQGTQITKMPPRSRVKVKAGGPLTIYGLDNDSNRISVINAGVMGNINFVQDSKAKGIEIQAPKSTTWQLEYQTPDMFQEHLDPEPIAIPIGKGELSTDQKIKEMVRIEMSKAAEASGYESFEEANDFEDDDDEDMLSGYEVMDMQEDVPFKEFKESEKRKRKKKENPSSPPTDDPESED
jgi:hypothetical protein